MYWVWYWGVYDIAIYTEYLPGPNSFSNGFRSRKIHRGAGAGDARTRKMPCIAPKSNRHDRLLLGECLGNSRALPNQKNPKWLPLLAIDDSSLTLPGCYAVRGHRRARVIAHPWRLSMHSLRSARNTKKRGTYRLLRVKPFLPIGFESHTVVDPFWLLYLNACLYVSLLCLLCII